MGSADEESKADLKMEHEEGDLSNATFVFRNEDHTLGNLLRDTIVKNKHVEFCASSVPPPNEPFMNVRIQAKGESDSREVLKQGLARIDKMCNTLESKFKKALQAYSEKQRKDD